MKTLFLKALITLLFASFVLPAGYELTSQQEPKNKTTEVAPELKKHKKHKKIKKHRKIKKHKKIKKIKRMKRGRN